MADLMKIAEEAFATGNELPAFQSGDTITVSYKIREGNKERIQQYRGVVIRISGHGTITSVEPGTAMNWSRARTLNQG